MAGIKSGGTLCPEALTFKRLLFGRFVLYRGMEGNAEGFQVFRMARLRVFLCLLDFALRIKRSILG